MKHRKIPHPLNVIGDFFVEDGCCMACEVPQTEASELFGITTEPHYHCFVKRQPQTGDEFDRIMSAIRYAEVQCIRYRGTAPAIFSRLSAMGQLDVCESDPPPGTELGLRIHLTFQYPESGSTTLARLSAQFKAFLKSQRGKYSRISFRWWSKTNTVSFVCNDGPWINVRFKVLESDHNTIHIYHDGLNDPGISWYLARWINSLSNMTNVHWYTDEGWLKTGVWHSDVG